MRFVVGCKRAGLGAAAPATRAGEPGTAGVFRARGHAGWGPARSTRQQRATRTTTRGSRVAHTSLPTGTAGHRETLPAWTNSECRGYSAALHHRWPAARHDNRAGQGSGDTCAHKAAFLGNTITLRAKRLGQTSYPAICSTLRRCSTMRSKKKNKECRNAEPRHQHSTDVGTHATDHHRQAQTENYG